MSNIYDVSIGKWVSEGKNPDDSTRVVTYADLVNKTIRMSIEIIDKLQAKSEDDVKQIYIVDGRKTVSYQQLTHSDNIRVYLKSNADSTVSFSYRFSGDAGQLPSLKCDEKDPAGVDYELSECVTAADVTVVSMEKIIRFRFDNITFRPCIKFFPGDGETFCSEVKIERTNDQANPHVKMMNGQKALFMIEAYSGSQTEQDYIYIGSSSYYSGSISEYDSMYGGSVILNCTGNSEPIDWLANQDNPFTVEPYYNNAEVLVTGRRNTPIQIQITTDSHISVRNMTREQYIDASTSYKNQVNYGTVAVSLQNYAGSFTTPINDPGHAYVTLMSQDLQKWDYFRGSVTELVQESDGNLNPTRIWNIDKQAYYSETAEQWTWGDYYWGIELHKRIGSLMKDRSYRLDLSNSETFYPTTVNVYEWRNLNIFYLYNSEKIKTQSRPNDDVWIHTFETKEDKNEITLEAVVTTDTSSYDEIGYNRKYAIVKISQSLDQNSNFEMFTGNGDGATATVTYVHNLYQLPRTLDLYLRVLPNVIVNFLFPKDYQIGKTKNDYSGGDPVEGDNYYNKLQIQFDAETVQLEQIIIFIKRAEKTVNPDWNYLTPNFYYNSSWQGDPDKNIEFSGINGQIFDVNKEYKLTVSNVLFYRDQNSTEFSILLKGSQRSGFKLTILIPDFHSGIKENYAVVSPMAESTEMGSWGGFFSPTLEKSTSLNLNGKVILYQGEQNVSVSSNNARPENWIGSNGIDYYFDVSDVDVIMLPETLSGVDTDITYEQYLPSTLYKEIKVIETSDVTVDSSIRTLTNSAYNIENYELSDPMFKFKINSGALNPSVTLEAIKWPDTDIYIFSTKIEIEYDESFCVIEGITSGSETFPLQNILRPGESSPYKYIYKLTLPDWFYGIKNNHKRTFRIQLIRNFEAGDPIQHGTGVHLKEIVKYQMTASVYDPSTGNFGRHIFNKDIDCSDKETEFYLDDAEYMTLSENIYNDASNLGTPMGIVVVPFEGEPVLTVAGIHYWMGTDYQGTMEFDNAYVSPRSHPSTVEWDSNDVRIYFKLETPEKYELSSSDTKIYIDETYAADFEFGKKVATGDDNTVTTDDGSTTYNKEYNVCFTIKVKNDLAIVNSLRQEPLYGTSMPLTFNIQIKKATGGMLKIKRQIKLAPIIDIQLFNVTGGTMKPKVDAVHYLRLRSCEWQWYSNGSIRVFEGYYKTVDGVNGRTCHAEFTYNNDKIQEVPAEPPYKSCRQNLNFDINAPAGEWGVWEVKIIDDTDLLLLGTMKGVYTITGGSDMKNWYNDDYSVQFDIVDMITEQRIDWWDGEKYITTSEIENALLSPVPYNINSELSDTVGVYFKFKDDHGLNINSEGVSLSLENSDFNDCFKTNVSYNFELDGNTYPLRIGVQTKCAIGQYNDNLVTRLFYTGQAIGFKLDINYTNSAKGVYTYLFSIKLGPVINITNGVASGRFVDYQGYPNGEYFANYLKAETGQKIVTQSRAHEWYSIDGGSTIVDTGNQIVGLQDSSDRTVHGRQYDIVWKYNGTVLTEKTGSIGNVLQQELLPNESVYAFTREFDNDYLKVQHAAAWTGDNGIRYYNDGGAWRVEVINMDSEFKSGNLTAQVTVTDDNPEISMHHWYDGGKTTVLEVKNIVSIVYGEWYDGKVYHGTPNLSQLRLSPVQTDKDDICVYFKAGPDVTLDNMKGMQTVSPAGVTSSEISYVSSDEQGTIGGGHSYDYILRINSNKSFYDANIESGVRFYTGQEIRSMVQFDYTRNGVHNVENVTFSMTLGPVLKINVQKDGPIMMDQDAGSEYKGVIWARANEYYLENSNITSNVFWVNASDMTTGSGTTENPVSGTIFNASITFQGGSYSDYFEIMDNTGEKQGSYTPKVKSSENAPEGTLKFSFAPSQNQAAHWYDNVPVTVDLPVKNGLIIVGSKYIYGFDQFKDRGTSLDNLILSDYNGRHECEKANIYIYINNVINCDDIALTYDNNDDKNYFENFLATEKEEPEESDNKYNGKEYTHRIGLWFDHGSQGYTSKHLLYDLWEIENGKRMYDGKIINMTLTGTLNGEVVAEYKVKITVGTFGRVHIGKDIKDERIVMTNSPGSQLTIASYSEIIEQDGSTSKAVKYVPDNSIVEEIVEFSDSETGSHIEKSYDSSTYSWTFKVPEDDPGDYIDPWWAKGSITINQRIMRDWYETEYKVIVFEKYINFYTDDPSASEYSVALCAWDVESKKMYCKNTTLSDNQQFSTSKISVMDSSDRSHEVHYMTFKVTVDNSGNTVIHRIYPNGSYSSDVQVLVGRYDRSWLLGKTYKTLSSSNFSVQELENENYNYGTKITLLEIGPTDSSEYGIKEYSKYNPTNSSWSNLIVDWNYRTSEDTLQSLDTDKLDDYPIWATQWRGKLN